MRILLFSLHYSVIFHRFHGFFSLCVFRVVRGSSCHSFGCRSLTSQPWGVVAAVRYPHGRRTSLNKNTLDYEIVPADGVEPPFEPCRARDGVGVSVGSVII